MRDAPLTFDAAGYDPADWIPVFEPLEEHDALRPHHWPTIDIDRVLFDPDNATGGEELYYVEDGGPGAVWLAYAPGRRKRDREMVDGVIQFAADIRGDPVTDAYHRIATDHATPYLTPAAGDDQLAHVSLPEGYDQALWADSVDSAVAMLHEARGLQTALAETATTYTP